MSPSGIGQVNEGTVAAFEFDDTDDDAKVLRDIRELLLIIAAYSDPLLPNNKGNPPSGGRVRLARWLGQEPKVSWRYR